ncbi:MAG: hypothetical protein JXR35_08765 [Rhodobacteraceae bacterium]|nr:hypothetical protein [Paracoccaceae bacterium]
MGALELPRLHFQLGPDLGDDRRAQRHSVEEIAGYEERFETTIARDKRTVAQRARDARPMEIDDFAALARGDAKIYDLPIRCAPEAWKMPKGAFNHASCGPS